MKKRLAMLLSVAMAFSMFANVAFGADAALTTEQKYQALVEAGIFNGIPGSNDPQLNVQTDRAQFAKILALTTGLEQVTDTTTFKDNGYATNWAKGYIEAVVKAGYMNGVGGDKFNLTGKITGEQMAKSFALALGLEEVKDAAAIDGVSTWAYGWVAAIKNAGFDFSMDGKWNTPVTRAVLIDAAYAVREQVSVKVDSVKAIDEKTVEVTFSDKEVVKVTLDKALVEGEKTTVEVKHSNGQTYKVEVTLQALAIEAKATGASKLEVKLNRTVDTAKAKIEVKRGTTTVAVKETKFSADGLTASVVLSNKLVAGDYTVSLSGVSEKAVTATVKAEAEKVEKIEFASDKLAMNESYTVAKVGVNILNQYGEDASKIASMKWDTTKGTATLSNGILTLTTETTNKFNYGEKVVVTGIEQNTYKVATSTLEVGLVAKAATVEFKGVYNEDGATLNTDSDFSDFFLLFDVKDQYGNKLSLADATSSLVVASSNPSIAKLPTTGAIVGGKGENGNSLAISFADFEDDDYHVAGDVVINAIALGSGQTFTYTLKVEQATRVSKITLTQPDAIAAGDTGVEIPFVAYDQDGKEVTAYSALQPYISLTASSGQVKWVKDGATGKASIQYSAVKEDGTVLTSGTRDFILASINGTVNNSNILVEIKDQAVATTVSGVTGVTALGEGATITLNDDNITLEDQYGRSYSWSTAYDKGIKVGVTKAVYDSVNAAGKVTINANNAPLSNGNYVLNTDGSITVTGVKKGTQAIELALFKQVDGVWTKISNSEHSFNVSVADKGNIAEYVVEDLGTIYAGSGNSISANSDFTKSVSVYGKKANGDKVKLAASEYTVLSNNAKLAVSGSTLTASGLTTSDDDVKTSVTVLINANGTQSIITKEITLSGAAPKAVKLATGDAAGAVTKVNGNYIEVSVADLTSGNVTLADIAGVVKVTDQYGVTGLVNTSAVRGVIYNLNSDAVLSGQGTSAVALNGVASGDSFTISLTTESDAQILLTVSVVD